MASASRLSSGAAAHDYRDELASPSDDDMGDGDGTEGAAAHPEPSSRGPPRKRNRAALSCTLCRQRKVKCDRVIPCSQCVKRGDEQYCHLDPHKKGPASSARPSGEHAPARSSHSHSHSHAHPPAAPGPVPTTLSPERHAAHSAAPAAHAAHAPHPPRRSEHTYYPASSSAPAPAVSPPVADPYEVAAIKQRLAQLEAALAAQAPRLPEAAAPQPHGYEAASGPSRFPLAASASQSSFAPPVYPPSPPVSTGSSSRGASSHAAPSYWPQSLFSQHDGVTRLPPLGAPSPGAGSGSFPFDGRFGRSQSVASSSGTAPGSTRGGGDERAPSHSSRAGEYAAAAAAAASKTGDVDSDTEDAALVLEGLAMGGRSRNGPGPACRTQQSKASGVAADGAASVRCPAEEDVIRRKPHRVIQDFVDADGRVDIMSTGVLSRVGADATMVDASAPDEEESKGKPSACPGEAGGAGGGNCPSQAEIDELKDLPLDATVDKHGKSISPAKTVCRLIASHPDTLLRLVSGPETHLGWGIGWAFTAAEAAGDLLSVQKLKGCPGAQQREAVLRAIIRSLPSKEVADHLVNVYDSRVKVMAGMTIHMPSFRKELDALYALDSVEKKARVVNIVDPGWLAQLLSVFVLALHFHPCEESPTRNLVMHLFDGRTVHLWRSAAHTCLVLARYQTSSSLAVLVTIIHLNLHSAGSGRDDTRFLSIAISNAREMGLHRLNMKERQPKAGEELGVQIRREMAKRIWAMLVIKDWGSASNEHNTYTIHPDQYNTPPPLNLNDEDLCQRPLPKEEALSTYTDMSFSLMQLKISHVVREHVDLQNRREREGKKLSHEDIEQLDGAYRRLLSSDDCAFYRVGSDEGAGTRLEVERFLVQQSIFHRLLRLHRPNLSSSRSSCVLLARSILDLQRRIRVRCSIVDRLFLNLSQSFSAAVVLILDLLQTRPNPSMRDLVRGEVGEAVRALRHVASASHTSERSIRVLEALLAEEQARWDAAGDKASLEPAGGKRKRDAAPNGQRKKNLLSLALRVARAANGQALPEDVEMAEVAAPASRSGSATAAAPNDAVAAKDAQSRDLFEQLTQANPRPYEPASFAHFDDPNASSSYMPGLDFLPLTPPDGDPFDITKFLAEYDSPPLSDAASAHGSATHAPGMQHNDSFVSNNSSSSNTGAMHSRSSFGDGGSSSGGGGVDFSGASAQHSPQTSLESGVGGGVSKSLPSPTNGSSDSAADALWAWMLTQGAVQPGGRLEAQQQAQATQQPLGQPGWQAPTAAQSQAARLPGPASIAEWDFDARAAAEAATHARHAASSAAMSAPSVAAADLSLAAAPSPASLANIFAHISDVAAPGAATSNSPLKRSTATTAQDASLQVSTPSANLPGYNPNYLSTPGGWEFSFDLLS